MTVNDLIKKLYKYPLNSNVNIEFDYGVSEESDCNVICTLEVDGCKKPVMKASCDM